MVELKWQMFMAHIATEEIDYVEETLKTYDIGGYLIGLEKEPYEHMHFAVEMSDPDYHKFSKRVFKDKFKLRGRATQGKCRQYGKEKEVKDIEKMLAYTAKDKNIRTNLPDGKIKEVIGKSFKKVEKLEFLDQCAKELEEWYMKYCHDNQEEMPSMNAPALRDLRIGIIHILRKKDIKAITKSKVESVLYRYLSMPKKFENYTVSDDYIYNVLYNSLQIL